MLNNRIFEVTMFWNEDALFRARIVNTLSYAERLYIAEGNESHSGAIKREYRLPQLIRDLPNELRSRVIPVLVPMEKHTGLTPFAREKIVRDAASTQLLQDQKLTRDDFLFVTDFDEFIHPDEARKIQTQFPWYVPFRRGMRLKQRLTFFRLNLLSPDDWTLAICLRGDELSRPDFSANRWRHEWAKKRLPITREFTGWHHSYYGDVAFIKNKIQSFAEANIDMVRQLTDEQIMSALESGSDLYGRGQVFQKIRYEDYQPIPALKNS